MVKCDSQRYKVIATTNVMTLRTFVVNRCDSLAFHVLGLYLFSCVVL